MILKRYIYKEITQRVFWVLVILILILSSIKLVGFLSDAAEGKIPSHIVLALLGYKILAILPRILPIILMLSVVLAFSNMAHDKELVILAASGVSRRFQLKITLNVAIIYACLAALICLYLSPLAEQRLEQIKTIARQEASTANITAGRFKKIGLKDSIFYVESRLQNEPLMQNAFLHSWRNNNLNIIKSDKAHIIKDPDSGDRFIEFQQGRHYVGKPGMRNYRIAEFDTYAILIGRNTEQKAQDEDFLRKLWRAETPAYQAEFHWRLGVVIACILLSLFSVMLNQFTAIGKGLLAIIAIISYLIYSNLLSIGMTLIKRELVPAAVGLWWVHALLLIGIILLYFLPNIRWRRKKTSTLQVPKE